MAAVPTGITDRRIAGGRVAVVVTILAWIAYSGTWFIQEFIDGRADNMRSKVEAVCYLLIVSLLTASALAYLVSRLGFFYRVKAHRRTSRAALDEFYEQCQPTLTVIVPSYREEVRVVRTTLLSAALQSYAGIEIVLLIDDPPNPGRRSEFELLQAARALPQQIESILAEPAGWFAERFKDFERVRHRELGIEDMVLLASTIDDAVTWLNRFGEDYEIVDHADAFFRDYVVRGLAANFAVDAAAIRAAAGHGITLPLERFAHFYRRLAATFDVRVSSFERKAYATLSHEPNKAMNLNSYIGLMGRRYFDVESSAGRMLIPAGENDGDLAVRDPQYVVTLDADSVLLPEYCERIIYLMEQSKNARVAVMQTPYSSYPGSATRLERIAGATTDLQHIAHQGLAHYDAVFWVGANAVLRKKALDEVAEVDYLDNWEIRRYIRDRTVIEDTESTIDLAIHDWTLANYPERLSYSSTPPDFGSLCIQRRRWANGGLIILPKLRRQVKARRSRGQRTRFGELFLRANYMASICWSTLSLVVLLAYPFRDALVLPILGVIALPYFVAMASDLKYCGYKRTDVFRIYGFNLALLVVNLAGVGASLVQAITGDKSAFGRTPKVRNRTSAGLLFVVAPYVLVGLAAFTFWRDYEAGRWDNAVYAALNGTLMIYAIVAYIGIRHSITDICVQLVSRLYKPEKPLRSAALAPSTVLANPAVADWASVLQLKLVDPAHERAALAAGAATDIHDEPVPAVFDLVGDPRRDVDPPTVRELPSTVSPNPVAHSDLTPSRLRRTPHPAVRPGLAVGPEPTRGVAHQRVLSEAEVDALSVALGEHSLLALLMIRCGLRWSEVIGLRVCDFDLDKATVTLGCAIVRNQGQLVWRSRPHWKRTVALPHYLLPGLEARVWGRSAEDFIFTGANGEVLDKALWVADVFAPAVAQVAGLDLIKVHDLRHTFAANVVRSGATLERLRAVMGQESLARTIELYGYLFPSSTVTPQIARSVRPPVAAPSVGRTT